MWPSPQSPADFLTFAEEIRNREILIFCAAL